MAQSKCAALRSLFCVAAAMAIVASVNPARAQSANAERHCTPDVMRLCSDAIPDRNRIIACMKTKRRQLSPQCLSAMTPPGRKKAKAKRPRRM